MVQAGAEGRFTPNVSQRSWGNVGEFLSCLMFALSFIELKGVLRTQTCECKSVVVWMLNDVLPRGCFVPFGVLPVWQLRAETGRGQSSKLLSVTRVHNVCDIGPWEFALVANHQPLVNFSTRSLLQSQNNYREK